MIRATPTLKSKLRPPARLRRLERRRHWSLSNAVLRKRLTTVTGGAGYGKTTFTDQTLLRETDAHIVWYRMDSSDGELLPFLTYFVEGIGAALPNFGRAVKAAGIVQTSARSGSFQHLCDLLAELERKLESDLILVLDDFHRLDDSCSVPAVLDYIIEHATPKVHLIVISRSPIPLSLSRLKAQQQLLEITTTDLALSRGEAKLLYTEILKSQWDSDLLDRIYDLTQGWVCGLMLLHHAFQNSSQAEISKCLQHASFMPEPVAEYLEEEVYSPLEPEIKDFLLKTSLLSRLQPCFCDTWLKTETSHDILRYLASHNLFIDKVSMLESGYAHNNLFRRFLRQKLMTSAFAGTVTDLHHSAAGLYEELGDIEAALRHLLAADDFKKLIRLLNSEGMRLYREGSHDILKTCLDTIPQFSADAHSRIQCLRGKLSGISGDYATALHYHGRVLTQFEQQGQTAESNLCRIEIALNYYLSGQFSAAAKVLQRMLTHPSITEELHIEALGYFIYISTHLRHTDSWAHCGEIIRSSLDLLESRVIGNRLRAWLEIYRGYACIATGDYEEALELARIAEWRIKQLDNQHFFSGHYGVLASAYSFLQRFEEGLACACKGLAVLVPAGLRDTDLEVLARLPARSTPAGDRDRGGPDTTLPIMLLQAARNAFGLGRTEEAIDFAGKSVVLFRAMGVQWGQALALNTLCTAYARKGDTTLAEQCGSAGLDLLRGLDLPLMQGTLQGNLAAVLMSTVRHEEALPLLREAEKALAPIGFSHWIDLWFAKYHWHENRERGRAELLAVLETLAEEKNYCIVAERHWIVPLLVDIYAHGHLRNYIFDVLQKIGNDAVHDLKQLLRESSDVGLRREVHRLLRGLPKPDPPGLEIHLLGRFQVVAGERRVEDENWANQKVRSLFQYLAYYHDQGYVSRDVLIEMLWPDQDPSRTVNRFHVTMTTLRRLLEPDLPDGAPSSYISRVGDSYRLELGNAGWVDIHRFNEELRKAIRQGDLHRALHHRLTAVAVYGGDLLNESPFCEWCWEIREILRGQYLDTLEAVISHYERCSDFETAILYAEKYIASARTAESMYRTLMRLYAEMGNPDRISATLRRCRRNLLVELECQVEPETEALAHRLLAEK